MGIALTVYVLETLKTRVKQKHSYRVKRIGATFKNVIDMTF